MINFAVASLAATNSGIWFHRRRTGPFPSWPTPGPASASIKLFLLTPLSCPNEKLQDMVCSCKASDLCLYATAVHLNHETNTKKPQPTKNTNTLASKTVKDIVSSDRTATSRAKPSWKERNPLRLSSSAAQGSIPPDNLAIIRYPLGTESAVKAWLESNTLVFIVDRRADKKNIRDAVMKVFKVRAKKVNTLITPDGIKKAYVKLSADCNALNVAKMIKFL